MPMITNQCYGNDIFTDCWHSRSHRSRKERPRARSDGIDPDRLPEEKRRGITIDLGFADLELDDLRIGFVDVPVTNASSKTCWPGRMVSTCWRW